MSCFYADWSSLGENNWEGEVVNGDMLGAESWMVRSQKKLEVGACEDSEQAMGTEEGCEPRFGG